MPLLKTCYLSPEVKLGKFIKTSGSCSLLVEDKDAVSNAQCLSGTNAFLNPSVHGQNRCVGFF